MQIQESKKQNDQGPFRFNQKANNQHPAIGVNFDNINSDISRDAYGQPLSPTSIVSNTKRFPQDLSKTDQENPSTTKASFKIQFDQKQNGKNSNQNNQQTQNINSQDQNKQNDKKYQQSEFLGPPKLAGLSTFEYAVDNELHYYCSEVNQEILDLQQINKYQNIFYQDFQDSKKQSSQQKQNAQSSVLINKKKIQIETDKQVFSIGHESNNTHQKSFVNSQWPSKGIQNQSQNNESKIQAQKNFQIFEKQNDQIQQNIKTDFEQSKYHFMEIQINLPQNTLAEYLELKFNQNKFDLFKKYLKISGVTKSSIIQKEALERDFKIGQDIQMTYLSKYSQNNDIENERKRIKAQKFFNINSGFLDEQKKIAELNTSGSVCNQVNILFEFNHEKAQEIIKQCQQIYNDKLVGKNDNETKKQEMFNQTEKLKHLQRNDNQHMKNVQNGQSQYLSSQGMDVIDQFDIDGSELDDLDNEVNNISQKLHKKSISGEDQGYNNQKYSRRTDYVKPEDINIIIDDQQEYSSSNNQNQGADFNQEKSAFQQKLSKTVNLTNQLENLNCFEDEKNIIEERKIFEGNNVKTWSQRLLQKVFQSIKIVGFNMSKIPAITNLSHLMNISFNLKKDQIYLEDALEVDFLLGTLLISSKRNTQAIELLRNKVQASYLNQIQHNISLIQGIKQIEEKKNDTNIQNQQQMKQLTNDQKQNLKVQVKKLFTRAAIIELLCSESMCTRPQVSEKLQALQRMTKLCRGILVPPIPFNKQIFLADDEYTIMIRILPFILKFSIQCIEYNNSYSREIVIVSALRNIQFILETQGCSLDSAMIVILKSIIKNYPDKIKQEKIVKRHRDLKAKLKSRAYDLSFPINSQNGFSLASQILNQKAFANDQKRSIGFSGTNSVNELNLRSGFNSTKEMHQNLKLQQNQNSARGFNVDQLRLDESYKNLQIELNKIFRQDKMSMIESIFSVSWIQLRDEPILKKEPNSGFEKTLMNLFNTLLDTYISVLSSISSHILHQIFYEVIVPCLTNQPFEEDKIRFDAMDKDEKLIVGEFSPEVKIYAVKIAEKIITICQGDLIMNKSLLDILVKNSSQQSYKNQLEMNGSSEQLRNQMKILWTSIRQKVFTNYSMKGFKSLVEWLANKLSMLAQNCSILDGKSSASDIAMLEISEEDLQQLCQYLEIVTYISVGRKNPQDEANQLIKIKQEYCLDLYLFLNPLLFWLDFSVERVERFSLFKQVYQTIKDVLDSLPPKKVEIDIFQIIVPILYRTSTFLKQNSPTQSMLKFMDIVLQDIVNGKFCNGNPELQDIFLVQLNSIVSHLSFSLFDEIFPVFDKLFQICAEIMDQVTLKKCIMAIVDANTQKQFAVKSKNHKQTIQQFMKSLLDCNTQIIVQVEQKDQQSKNNYNQQNSDFILDIQDQQLDIYQNLEQIQAQGKKKKINDAFIAQNNQKNKIQKSTFFQIMIEYCFFDNNDEPAKQAANQILTSKQISQNEDTMQFRSPQELHDIYVEKLQFFIDSLSLLGERHINQFNSLIQNRKFKSTLLLLLNRGETNLRLKCHEILEIIGAYFIQYCSSKTLYEIAVPQRQQERGRGKNPIISNEQNDSELMEVDLISHDRLHIAQLIILTVRKSFERENGNDSYLQFNSLILLDYLFQNILPVANFQNEEIKQRQNSENLKRLQQLLQIQTRNNSRSRPLMNAGSGQPNRDQNRGEDGDNRHLENQSKLEDGSSGGEGTGHTGRQQRNRIIQERIQNSNFIGDLDEGIDLEVLQINKNTLELEVTDSKYTAMRLKLVFKLWPYIQEALNSPWSNIRSICYGLICSMLKIDIRDCQKFIPQSQIFILAGNNEERKSNINMNENQSRSRERQQIAKQEIILNQQLNDEEIRVIREFDEKDKEQVENNKFYQKLRQSVIPMMINLLSSKESESKAGGLNILGSICGLSYDFSKVKISRNFEFFKRNSEFISLPIWQHVFQLQDDWDITIKEASIVLIQLCAPREAIKYFNKCKIEKDNIKFMQLFNKMHKNNNGQGGPGSLSNLSSGRQNSFYNNINSKGSLNGLKKVLNEAGTNQNENQGIADSSNRRMDYKNVDFGYKDKHIPIIQGLLNEFGKLDMATFLNDNQDMMSLINVENINHQDEEFGFKNDQKLQQFNQNNKIIQSLNRSSVKKEEEKDGDEDGPTQRRNILRIDNQEQSIEEPAQLRQGAANKNLALDLNRINKAKEDKMKKTSFEIEAVFQMSSMSHRSNFFQQNLFDNQQSFYNNQQLLNSLQVQNYSIAQAIHNTNLNIQNNNLQNTLNQSQQSLIPYKSFDFFVDQYSDEQVQEIISIFRNDFKPPKNLWIEKAAESSVFNGPDLYQDIFSREIEQFNQQQLILQQKQQQELQEQVSNGSSLSQQLNGFGVDNNSSVNDKNQNNLVLDVGPNSMGNQSRKNEEQKVGELDQMQNSNYQQNQQIKLTDNDNQNQYNQQEQNDFDQKQQNQEIDNEYQNNQNKEKTSLKEKLQQANNQTDQADQKYQNQGSKDVKLNIEQNKKSQGQKYNDQQIQEDQNKKFDPTRDLNIFEQINFDDMNINLEDINQSKQKQDVINSSNSDIGEDMQISHQNKPTQYFQNKQNQMDLNDSAVSGFSDVSSQNHFNGQIIQNMEFEENYSDEQEYIKDNLRDKKSVEQEQNSHLQDTNQQEQKRVLEINQKDKNIKELKRDIDAAHQLDLQGMDMNNGFEMIKFSGHSSNSDSQQEYPQNQKNNLVTGSQEDILQKYFQKQNNEKNKNQRAKVKNEIEIIDQSQEQKKSPIKDIPEKYNKIGQIGTELQVIESQSNEVSSSGCAIQGLGDKINQKQQTQGKNTKKQISDSQDYLQMDKNLNNYLNNKQISINSQLKIIQDSDTSENDIEGLDQFNIDNNLQNNREPYQNGLQYYDILQNGFDEKKQENYDFLDDDQFIDSDFQNLQPHEFNQKISQQIQEQDKILEKFEQKNSKTLQMIHQEEKQISNKVNRFQNHEQGDLKQNFKMDQNLKKSIFDQNLLENQIKQKNKTQVLDFKKIRNQDKLQEQIKQDNNQQMNNIIKKKKIKNKITDSSNKGSSDNNRNKITNLQKQIINYNKNITDSQIQSEQIEIDKIADEQLKQIEKLQNVNQQQNQKAVQNQQPVKINKKQPQISVTNKHQNQIESARQNFVSAQIPIQSLQSSNNLGNFSHRVGHSTKHQNFQQQLQQQNDKIPASLSNYQSLQNVNIINNCQSQSVSSTVNLQNQQVNKQLLKNIKKQIKNGNEDYYIMQNISNQMGGKLVQSQNSGVHVQNQLKNENNNLLSLSSLFYANNMNLTTSGLNTTKHNKTDKNFENLIPAYTNKKGESIIQSQIVSQENMNISGNLQTNQRKQHSNDSSKPQIQIRGQNTKQRHSKNQITEQNSNSQSFGKNKSMVKQKTLSNSPKNRKPNISDIKKLLSNTTMIPNYIEQLGANNMSYGTVQIQKAGGGKNKSINDISKIQNQIQNAHQNMRAQSKTHRGAGHSNPVMALGNITGCGSSSSAVQQNANQYLTYNNAKNENMKDLNYLIKTLEKFSKNSVSINMSQNVKGPYVQQADISKIQQHNNMNAINDELQSKKQKLFQSQNYPKIMSGYQDGLDNPKINKLKKSFQDNRSNRSDPQTPNEKQINFGNQILNNISTDNQIISLGHSQQKQYRSKSNQNSANANTRKIGSKSKQNSLINNAISQQNNSIALKNQVISQKSKSSMLGMIQANNPNLNIHNPKNTKNLLLQLQQENNQKYNNMKITSERIQNVLKNNNGFNLSHLNILINQSQNPISQSQSQNTGAPAFIINQGKKNDEMEKYISIRNKISHANTQQIQKCKKKVSSESRSHGRSGTGNTRGMFDLTPDNNCNTSVQRRKNLLTEQSNAQRKNEQNKGSKSNKNRQNEQKASYSPPQTECNPYFENIDLGKHLLDKLHNNNQTIPLMNQVAQYVESRSVDSKGRSQSTNKSGSQNRKTSKSKKKKFSFSLNQNQPLQLNDLVYSCTQKLDMQDINRNLKMINNHKKGSGSTQNKQLNRQIDMLMPNKKVKNMKDNMGQLNLNSQRQQREKSSDSNNSKNRYRNGRNNNLHEIQQQNN